MGRLIDPIAWLIVLSIGFGYLAAPLWIIAALACALTLVSIAGDPNWRAKLAAANNLPEVFGFGFGAVAANAVFAAAGYGFGSLLKAVL